MSGEAGLLRVLTWNIHRGVGPDGRYDLGRVADLIRRHDPDIVALQEIDSRGRAHGPESPLAFLAGALGGMSPRAADVHVAEARTILAPDGHYGHALISRWPLSPPLLHDISVSRREPRFAIETTASTAAGPLHVAAVHLGPWIGERRRQARRLAQIADSGAVVSVMLGDFNDWPWRGVVRRTLAAALPGRTRHRTFPARRPLLMLDRVYCRPPQALVRSWTDPAGRRISDHLPVIAEIRLPPAALPAAAG